VLFMRVSYMLILAVAVGRLAREEVVRSQEVEQIEQLNAENAKLVSRTERAARYDRLTGLLNRAYFEKEFRRELRKARSSRGYLSILFCDMDRLKQVNDELGHDFGDRVLKQVAASLKRELRSNEAIGRFGGDEFVVMLPNLTRESAFERGEQLVAAVEELNNGAPDHLRIGVSIGVATCPFDATEYSLLLKLADQAMYLAKREGGARVRTANDLRLFWEDLPKIAS
jgi:diguanylate cyclase (GGDEF)-like protein